MNGSDLLDQYRSTASEDAFTGLVRRYANLVYSVAWRRLSNRALAEEAAQVVFTRLATARPKIATDPELVAWLHRTTVHVSIDLWRSESRRRTRELTAAMDVTANETTQSWDEIAAHLDEALNDLNDGDRQVLLLRFFASKSMIEIGRIFAISEDAAKMRVSRALERLRTQLLPRAAALSAIALGSLVAERSVEAAPPALILRLCSIHGLGASSAMVEPLLQTTRAKVIAAAGLAITLTLLLVSRGRHSTVDTTATQNQQEQKASAVRRPLNFQRADPGNPLAEPAAPPNIRMLLRVIDAETDQPLSGAQIRAFYFYAGGRGEPNNLLTDQNGEAAIPEPLEAGQPGMNLFVSAEGYVPKAIGFGTNVPSEYVFKAERAAVVAGVVVDDAGRAVPDVTIEASRSEDYKEGKPNTDFQTATVRTDSNGQFLYPYIPRSYEEVRFYLTCDGYAVTDARVSMRTAQATNAKLVIKRGFAIAGRVTDSGGASIANAKVKELHNYAYHRQLSTKTDFNGDYLLLGISDLGEPKAQIIVEADHMASQLKTVELRDATNTLNFVLVPGTLFRGHVIDEAGQPIANAAVRTDVGTDGRQPFPWFTRTDTQGHFEWDSAPAQPVLFWFGADGYEVSRDRLMTPDGTDFEIKLKRKAKTN